MGASSRVDPSGRQSADTWGKEVFANSKTVGDRLRRYNGLKASRSIIRRRERRVYDAASKAITSSIPADGTAEATGVIN